MAIQQLLGSGHCGYGGVERVAHELSNCWGGVALQPGCAESGLFASGRVPGDLSTQAFAIDWGWGALARALLSRSLITMLASSEPLHGHLPSPGVLLLLVLARLLKPRRIVTPWHCFLQITPGFKRPFVWVVSVDRFASSSLLVSSSHHITSDVC